MAIKPKVFKITLQIADIDRHYYNEHLLTIAQHSSETDERAMIRILAFALNANDTLSFAEGISDSAQADVWDRDHNEQIKLWVSVGLPEEKLIRKAVSRAEHVIVYSYGGRGADVWWNKLKLDTYKNLKVVNFLDEDTKNLATLLVSGMKINFTIQEGEIMVANESKSVILTPQIRMFSRT